MKSLSLLLFAALTTIALNADAQSIYDWNDPDVPVVVETNSKLFFIGKKKAPIRVYSWKSSKGKNKKGTYFADLDRDGTNEIVGAGRPLFTLSANSDPIKFDKRGCDQALVADFAADNKLDIACLNGKNIKVLTHDMQLVWKSSIGKKFSWCRAGDVNGDLKADLECAQGKKFSRFDGATGELLAGATDTQEVNNPMDKSLDPVPATSIGSKTAYDLNGDGTKKEVLTKDGKALFLGSAKVDLDNPPLAALVKDIDKDKKLEVIAITKSSFYVISGDAKKVTRYRFSKKFKRVALAELKSVYANGFKDDKAAKKLVEDSNAKLSKCYSSQVRKNQFAGTGEMLIEVNVGEKGKVSKVTQHHSSLADKSVGKCAKAALKKIKFGEPAAGAASVNVTMRYTFEDQ